MPICRVIWDFKVTSQCLKIPSHLPLDGSNFGTIPDIVDLVCCLHQGVRSPGKCPCRARREHVCTECFLPSSSPPCQARHCLCHICLNPCETRSASAWGEPEILFPQPHKIRKETLGSVREEIEATNYSASGTKKIKDPRGQELDRIKGFVQTKCFNRQQEPQQMEDEPRPLYHQALRMRASIAYVFMDP